MYMQIFFKPSQSATDNKLGHIMNHGASLCMSYMLSQPGNCPESLLIHPIDMGTQVNT
jgi:hypothetical protein